MHRTLPGLAFLLVVLAACSSDPDSPPAGGDSGTSGGSIVVSCSYPAKFTCGAQTFTGDPGAQVGRDKCTQDGGTVGTVCPAANLIGCCTQSIIKNCFYTGHTVTAAKGETDCKAANGTWATTP